MRVVQLSKERGDRRVAVVDDEDLCVLNGPSTVFALAKSALDAGTSLRERVARNLSPTRIAYQPVYAGTSEWRILPVVDHPDDPGRLIVSGTGLTHRRSADQRQSMHAASTAPTDSLRMYELGVEGGRPGKGSIGHAPEWFYKGAKACLFSPKARLLLCGS